MCVAYIGCGELDSLAYARVVDIRNKSQAKKDAAWWRRLVRKVVKA